MKRLHLTLLAILSICLQSLGQGTVNFNNRVLADGIDAPVTDVDKKTLLQGDGFLAQLFAGPSASALAAVDYPDLQDRSGSGLYGGCR